MVVEPARLANGSLSFVGSSRISLVPIVAAAISDIGLVAAAHRLDTEHFPYLRRLARAYTWSFMGIASWLGHASGIRMRGSSRGDVCIAEDHEANGSSRLERILFIRPVIRT